MSPISDKTEVRKAAAHCALQIEAALHELQQQVGNDVELSIDHKTTVHMDHSGGLQMAYSVNHNVYIKVTL